MVSQTVSLGCLLARLLLLSAVEGFSVVGGGGILRLSFGGLLPGGPPGGTPPPPVGLEPGPPFRWGAPPPGLLGLPPPDLVLFGSYPDGESAGWGLGFAPRIAALLGRSLQNSVDSKVHSTTLPIMTLTELVQVLEVDRNKVVQLAVLHIQVELLLVYWSTLCY